MSIVASDLASLKLANISDISMIYNGSIFTWTAGDFTGKADDIHVVASAAVAVTVGAWIRQTAKSISITNTHGDQVIYARPRTVDDLLDTPRVNIRAFANGPVELENPFDLLNRATGAALPHIGNGTDLARTIDIDVPLVFPAEDRSVFVRKGQTLNFANGRQLDLSALANNTKPVFELGRGQDGTADQGGLPIRILFLNSIGGPSTAGVIRASNAVQGYTILAPFITSAGVGLDLRGSQDGIIDMAQIDQCLTGVRMSGQNNNIGFISFFKCNYDVIVASDCFECGIDFLHSEYYANASLQFDDGATNILGFRVNTHRGVQNDQFETSTGFVNLRSSGADITIGNAEYRNGRGAAIRVGTGLGNRLTFGHLLLDGRKTHPLYAQSLDMGGVEWMNGKLTIKSLDARFLQAQPVLISGAFETRAWISNAEFDACTGASSEISITSTGVGSHVQLYNVHSSRGDSARYFNSGTGTVGGAP